MSTIPQIINGTTEKVSINAIKCHPRNARQGDIGAICVSIAENGFYGHVVVQRSTGYIIIGNHRYQAAVKCGMLTIPVVYVDVDDDRALRLLLVDNKTSDDASYDDHLLAGLLAEMSDRTDLGLTGTGFTNDDLDDLVTKMTGAPTMSEGDDKPPTSPKQLKLCVVVTCQDELEQAQVEAHVKDGGFYEVRLATLEEINEVKERKNGSPRKRRGK